LRVIVPNGVVARCSTAGGVATTTGGPSNDDGDVEAPAVRIMGW
jgi:hypothetical protein